jgi:hypothetical protein
MILNKNHRIPSLSRRCEFSFLGCHLRYILVLCSLSAIRLRIFVPQLPLNKRRGMAPCPGSKARQGAKQAEVALPEPLRRGHLQQPLRRVDGWTHHCRHAPGLARGATFLLAAPPESQSGTPRRCSRRTSRTTPPRRTTWSARHVAAPRLHTNAASPRGGCCGAVAGRRNVVPRRSQRT